MIRTARAADAPALAALLNHWILNTAVTFNPVPKTADDILAMIAAKAADGHAFQAELQFLLELRHELGIDRLHAAAIERGSAARHRRQPEE